MYSDNIRVRRQSKFVQFTKNQFERTYERTYPIIVRRWTAYFQYKKESTKLKASQPGANHCLIHLELHTTPCTSVFKIHTFVQNSIAKFSFEILVIRVD